MKIRNARAEDATVLPDVERSAGQAFLSIPDLAWIADDDVQSVARHLALIAGGYAWVAVENETPIGFISAEKTEDALHIWELSVHADFQGRGIGRALIARAAGVAKADGLSAVTLTTFRDVAWNEPFYKSLGFQTLPADAMPKRIQVILDDEAAHGLPRERRCGMMLRLRMRDGRSGGRRPRSCAAPHTAR
jgi:GNAT superfamily N-acetyltransferase